MRRGPTIEIKRCIKKKDIKILIYTDQEINRRSSYTPENFILALIHQTPYNNKEMCNGHIINRPGNVKYKIFNWQYPSHK